MLKERIGREAAMAAAQSYALSLVINEEAQVTWASAITSQAGHQQLQFSINEMKIVGEYLGMTANGDPSPVLLPVTRSVLKRKIPDTFENGTYDDGTNGTVSKMKKDAKLSYVELEVFEKNVLRACARGKRAMKGIIVSTHNTILINYINGNVQDMLPDHDEEEEVPSHVMRELEAAHAALQNVNDVKGIITNLQTFTQLITPEVLKSEIGKYKF